jgi:hypothetical protein
MKRIPEKTYHIGLLDRIAVRYGNFFIPSFDSAIRMKSRNRIPAIVFDICSPKGKFPVRPHQKILAKNKLDKILMMDITGAKRFFKLYISLIYCNIKD